MHCGKESEFDFTNNIVNNPPVTSPLTQISIKPVTLVPMSKHLEISRHHNPLIKSNVNNKCMCRCRYAHPLLSMIKFQKKNLILSSIKSTFLQNMKCVLFCCCFPYCHATLLLAFNRAKISIIIIGIGSD